MGPKPYAVFAVLAAFLCLTSNAHAQQPKAKVDRKSPQYATPGRRRSTMRPVPRPHSCSMPTRSLSTWGVSKNRLGALTSPDSHLTFNSITLSTETWSWFMQHRKSSETARSPGVRPPAPNRRLRRTRGEKGERIVAAVIDNFVAYVEQVRITELGAVRRPPIPI